MLQCICVYVGHHLSISWHSLDDLLELLASRVNSENQFRICVSRDNLLERGLKQWQRQKKGNPVNHLKITFMWITGQGHKPLLLSEQNAFQICFKFDHDCKERMPQHTICYPIVSTCTQTITFPVAHMTTYEDFKCIIVQAIKSGDAFSRV